MERIRDKRERGTERKALFTDCTLRYGPMLLASSPHLIHLLSGRGKRDTRRCRKEKEKRAKERGGKRRQISSLLLKIKGREWLQKAVCWGLFRRVPVCVSGLCLMG